MEIKFKAWQVPFLSPRQESQQSTLQCKHAIVLDWEGPGLNEKEDIHPASSDQQSHTIAQDEEYISLVALNLNVFSRVAGMQMTPL